MKRQYPKGEQVTRRAGTTPFVLAALVFACLRPLAAGSDSTASPRVFLLDAKHLQATRQRLQAGDKALAPALAQLEREARQALGAGPFSVLDKKFTPPSGDKHDYMSQAPYFWPNPKTTNGLPYVRRDGERNPEIGRISDHSRLFEMTDTVETLALAHYFKGDERFAEKAARLLRAWFLEPTTRMNPNLQYAQAVPGVNTGRGIGLIESRALTRVVDAVGLLGGSRAWTATDQRQLQNWFAQFLGWMRESNHGREEAAAKNNHGTYYDVQVASYALFLDQRDVAEEIVRGAREKRIAVQIEPDGRQPLELVRTKAWSYSVANLSGLMSLATLGESVGVDLWHYQTADGRSIQRALDYLAPFALEGRKWRHQQIGGWRPQTVFPLVRRAALKFHDPKYGEWVKQMPPLERSDRSHLLRPTLAEHPEAREQSRALLPREPAAVHGHDAAVHVVRGR